jgi:ERCC4-type nuclease
MNRMSGKYYLVALVVAVVLLYIGHNALGTENLREAMWSLSLSIVFIILASTVHICSRIDDLKEEIQKTAASESDSPESSTTNSANPSKTCET